MIAKEPLISENRKPQLQRLIYKLIEKLETNEVLLGYPVIRRHTNFGVKPTTLGLE